MTSVSSSFCIDSLASSSFPKLDGVAQTNSCEIARTKLQLVSQECSLVFTKTVSPIDFDKVKAGVINTIHDLHYHLGRLDHHEEVVFLQRKVGDLLHTVLQQVRKDVSDEAKKFIMDITESLFHLHSYTIHRGLEFT